MKKGKLKKGVSMLLVAAMLTASISGTGMGKLEAQAADNSPKVEYSFEEISAMANIPVMNLTMADSSKYDTLKTDKETKQNIGKFELVNTNGKGEDITLETKVDSETGETVYPLTAKGRGNSSWTMPTGKKPYNIKFDKKQDILGMGKAKSWCLIANWVDTTYMRNYMAYELACMLGLGTPDCEMVALCIDGVFEGIYLITEKVGLNDYRTEIPEGETDGDKNGDGITTEIIVEADIRADEYQEPGRFRTDNNVSFVPKDPDPEDLAASELQEIKKELNAMETAVMSGTNYEEYIDVDSWVDTYIVNELAKNPDFGFGHQNCYASTYLYFREGGKIYAGPVWDFDIAYGRNDYSQMESEGYRDIAGTTGYLSKETKYYKELFENTDFEERVIKRWKEIRETIIPVWMGSTFNEGYESVKVLNPIDIEIWGDHTGRVAGSYNMGRDPLAFEEEVAYVQNFIAERVAWLDEQWNVDEISKKFSGSWTRWDVKESAGYSSYDELVSAAEAGSKKTDVADIWDGGYGGKEKSGTEVIEVSSKQSGIPGVDLANPFTITMVRQRGQYDWSSDTTHAYDIWRDTEASQGFGSVKDSITVTKSGRYVGLTTASYYIGDTTAEMGKNNVQVYIIDVGTDGSVTLYDGSVALSYEARTATVKNTNYGKIEAVNGGYKVSYQSNGRGNTGQTIGGNGNKQFEIYVPNGATELKVTTRPAESNYANQPLSQEATYIHAAGERPVAWNVEGDAVVFDEVSQKVTAVKAGTAVITATAAGGIKSSVTINVEEKTTSAIEYEGDPTLGKYFGNGDSVVLAASEIEKGSWATMAPGNLTRFSFAFDMTKDDVANASGFSWQTKNGDQLIGGPADYYVFVNGNPLFAATADTLNYAITGFDASNTIKIADTELAEGFYAYMNGKAGNVEGKLEGMKEFVQAGTNVIDVFVDAGDGCATVLPYIGATTKITDGESEPVEPDVPVVPEEPEIPEDVVVTIESAEEIVLGESIELNAVIDKEVSDASVTWTIEAGSENAVLEGNVLTGKVLGIVTVKATSNYNKECFATKEITVVRPAVEAIEIAEGDFSLVEKQSKDLTINVLPEAAGEVAVMWSTSDEAVATVDAAGKVTAVNVGTAVITATNIANNEIKAEVLVTVMPEDVVVTIESAEEVVLGESIELNAVIDKEVADTSVTWIITSGKDKAVLTDNVLTGKALGTVTVKATSNYNKECFATKEITVVRPAVEAIEIAEGNFTLEEAAGKNLTINVLPTEAGEVTVAWSTSDGAVATVSETGKVVAKGVGTAVITATCKDNAAIKAEVTVTVVPMNVKVSINSSDKVVLGKAIELGAQLDKEISDTSVTWTIEAGEENAVLDGNILTGKALGTVTVKATSNYNKECFATKTIEIIRPSVEFVEITDSDMIIEDGTKKALTINVLPANANEAVFVWSTSDKNVVAVDDTGVITAVGTGTATITVVCNSDNSIKDSIVVTVEPVDVNVMIDTADQLVLDGTMELKAVLDKEVSDASVTWTIESGSENAVLEGNVLTGKALGTVTVKATSNYNKECFATKEITVVRPAVEAIEIAEGDFSLVEKQSKDLTINVLPEAAGEVAVMWSTSDEAVATVDAAGKVTAVNVGTAVITATNIANNEIKAEVLVTVMPEDVVVTIESAEAVVLGESIELNAVIDKEVADTSVTWTITSGKDKAVLTDNVLTGKALGTVTVKATSNYNKECFATKEITVVRPAVEAIEIAEGNFTLEEAASKNLTINVLPTEAGEVTVAWSTSDGAVATVSETGKVVAKGVGTAVITATCKDNAAIKAEVTVTVVPMNVKVSINSSDKVVLGKAIELGAQLDKEISDTSVTWTIEAGEENAVLDGNILTGKALGTVTVKATSNYNKECFATKEITVVRPAVNEVRINEEDFTLEETQSTQLSVTLLPENAEETSVRWTSSDTSVATVDSNGKVTAIAEGTAVISASCTENNLKDQVTVTVTKMSYEFGFTNVGSVLELEDFGKYLLSTSFEPETVPNKTVRFTSSDSWVATVSANGLVTARKPGLAIITATSMYDTDKEVSIVVKVVPTTVKVSINAENTMTVGDEQKLSAALDKSVADTSVTWSIVDGKEFAELNGSTLKAKSEGTVTVKAVSAYNENCYTTTKIVIEKAAEEQDAPMVPGTPLASPIKISMELQWGQYEWSADTTHAYDIWEDGKAVHGFCKEKKELVITKAGRYVGITSASYYVGDITVQMGKGDVQVYVIDVANDGSVTVYDGKVKINYAQRTTSVVNTTYANVEKTNDGYFLSFKENGTGNAGTRVLNK